MIILLLIIIIKMS